SRVTAKGPVRAAIETRWRLNAGRERVDASVTLIVDANASFIRIALSGTNAAGDHRLRLGFRTGVGQGAAVVAAAMFGPAERRSIKVSAADAAFELPPATAPLHRYASLFGREYGATLVSDGLGEYEATDDAIYVTALRSVSELSRNDMPE